MKEPYTARFIRGLAVVVLAALTLVLLTMMLVP